MNRKKQLLDLISAKCRNLTSQELKRVRDLILSIEKEKEMMQSE